MNTKIIKKPVIVFLVLAIIVSFAGCGNVDEDTTSVSTDSSDSATGTDLFARACHGDGSNAIKLRISLHHTFKTS